VTGAGPARGSLAPATFRRAARVRSRSDFLRVQDAGVKVHARHFLLIALPTTSPELATRLGVVASKRVGGAVERNRCKRLVREVFRRHAASFPRAMDVVVVARPGAHELSFVAAEAELCAALPQLVRRAARLHMPAERPRA
jgi:ribonuclease P protein component